MLALLEQVGGDTSSLPDIAPLGSDWLRDLRRMYRTDVEQARTRNVPLATYLP